MATLAHAAAGLVIGRVHSNATLTPLRTSFVLFSALAVLPDLDVVVGQSRLCIRRERWRRGQVRQRLAVGVGVGTAETSSGDPAHVWTRSCAFGSAM